MATSKEELDYYHGLARRQATRADAVLREIVREHGMDLVFPVCLAALAALRDACSQFDADPVLAARYDAAWRKIHTGAGELVGALGVLVERDHGGDGATFAAFAAAMGLAVKTES